LALFLRPIATQQSVWRPAARFAWIAFAISFPCTVAYILTHFLKKANRISSYGRIHSFLAFLAEIGVIATTASLFFHALNVAGWVFLLWTLVIILGDNSYRFGIYYMPFISIFRDILKNISNTPPSAKE
jgi:uncharacterized transporter YbjL